MVRPDFIFTILFAWLFREIIDYNRAVSDSEFVSQTGFQSQKSKSKYLLHSSKRVSLCNEVLSLPSALNSVKNLKHMYERWRKYTRNMSRDEEKNNTNTMYNYKMQVVGTEVSWGEAGLIWNESVAEGLFATDCLGGWWGTMAPACHRAMFCLFVCLFVFVLFCWFVFVCLFVRLFVLFLFCLFVCFCFVFLLTYLYVKRAWTFLRMQKKNILKNVGLMNMRSWS